MTNNGKTYTMVMEKLNFEPCLDSKNITISVQGDHDIIVLGGKVSSYTEKFIAERAVKSLANIRGVANEIEVDLDIKYKKSDIDIAKDISRALKSTVVIREKNIQSVVKNGFVTLSGEVNWYFQKQNVFNLVHNITGIKSIINNIIVKPLVKINADEVKKSITREFERHARIDADKIEVIVNGTTITLGGKASNFAEMDDAEDVAWSVEGVEKVENNIKIV
jgi:osmotically-inducible protein OsmY